MCTYFTPIFEKTARIYLYLLNYDIINESPCTYLYLLHYDINKNHLVHDCTLFSISLKRNLVLYMSIPSSVGYY